MGKPNFIGIGAQKCASTWLYEILKEHPDVCVGKEKEINFFSHHFDHGYQWYQRHFQGVGNAVAIGEISPSYLYEPSVPKRIWEYSPDINIIVSFREPVQRAISNHNHEVRLGHFAGEDVSFEKGLENNPMYVEQGCYATHLEEWRKYFPKEQILVILMEDVINSPREIARQVYRFIGVEEMYEPSGIKKKYNKSFITRFGILFNMKEMVYKLSQTHGLGWVWKTASMFGLKSLYRRMNKRETETVIPEPKSQTIAALKNRFAPEMEKLSRMIQRPLDDWY